MPVRILLCLTLLSLAGCGTAGEATPTSSTLADAAAPAETAAQLNAAGEVTLQILDYDGIQKLLQSKQGKVVVLDAWSTSCEPCVREFPKLVALSKKYPDQIACVSVSFDYEGLDSPEEVSEPVLNFLKQQGAAFDNVMSNEEADTLYQKFDLVAVPAVFIYDAEGKLVKRFDNSTGEEFTYEQIEQYLLAEKLIPPKS